MSSILGGPGYGTGYDQGYGNRRPMGFGKLDLDTDALRTNRLATPVALNEIASAGTGGANSELDEAGSDEVVEIKLDALCFEKWRLIKESRRRGEPEFFTYAGMASPTIRKKLVLFPNQTNIHVEIEKELRLLGVQSTTRAFIDIFKHPGIKKVIDYYVADSKKVLAKDKSISGIIVTDGSKILAADVYSSPELFRKMFPQLMQSAAIAVCIPDHQSRKQLDSSDVRRFLDELKKARKLKKESSQTYKLYSKKLISGAELFTDTKGTRVVHVEAYPR